MNRDKYPVYALVFVAAAATAVWAGMPFAFLVFLVCPLMMFFMMKGMGGAQNDDVTRPEGAPANLPVPDAKNH